MKLYAAIAQQLNIIARNPSKEITQAAQARLEELSDALPAGSGFDTTPKPEALETSNPLNQYLIHGSYHRMNEHGCYDGWLDFTIRVFAQENFLYPWDIEEISQAEIEDEDTINYILDVYAEALNQEEPHHAR